MEYISHKNSIPRVDKINIGDKFIAYTPKEMEKLDKELKQRGMFLCSYGSRDKKVSVVVGTMDT